MPATLFIKNYFVILILEKNGDKYVRYHNLDVDFSRRAA